MRRIILGLVLFFLLANISLAANLGFYKAGDTVTYSVVCLTDEGTKDTGCTSPDDDILDPDDTTAKSPTSALAEVSDGNFPGLWRGSYTIPASPTAGTWSIFIELTNTNSTTAATVLNFQVLSDSNYPASHGDLSSGIVTLTSATETQIDNIETDTAAMDTSTELRTLLTGSDTPVSTLTASDNIGIDLDDVIGTLDATEIGTNAITSAKIAADAIGASEAGFLLDSTGFNGADISSILADTNEIQGNQSNFITATGFSTHSAADVWSVATRKLTYYPPTTAVVSLDISKSGFLNTSFYDVGRSHILGDLTPDEDESFKDYYYKKYNFDIKNVPDNITNAWLIIWLKKTGSPTGDLTIIFEGSVIDTIDVSTLTTSYQKFEISVGAGNFTDEYIEVQLNGSSSWTNANDVMLGAGEMASCISEESSDGSTWSHPDNEYAVGLIIEYNQKSIASLVNEESVYLYKTNPSGICPGQTLFMSLTAKDYQGSSLDVLTLPACRLMEILDNGSIVLNSTNIDETENQGHKIKIQMNGTYTSNLQYGSHYMVSCNGTVVEFNDGTNTSLTSIVFPFIIGTKAKCIFLNSTILSGFSDLKTYGDANWSTSISGLNPEQNATLYNTYAVVGNKDKYDQSIADMLGYNSSDGNVETDLDSAGGTTPAAVWSYNITGLNQTTDSAGWYVTVIKTIVEWIERFF